MAGRAERPEVSVVVPVRDGAAYLPHALLALRTSDLPPDAWELIVVDDGSRDESAEIATCYADRVLRISPPGYGPPAARNRGAAVARAPVIIFVDADVRVHPDALRRLRDTLAARPELSAVFGAYDLAPAAPGLVSQYRNLLHSYVHRRDAGQAFTFWTGLGAIRREALESAGGFDERERLDDVELGYRLTGAGRRILLDPDIVGTHLKRWTLANVVTTDVLYRGVPWVRLLLTGRRPPGRPTLNLRLLDQVLTLLTAVLLVLGVAFAATGSPVWLAAAGGVLMLMLAADWRLLRWLLRLKGWRFTLTAVPLRLLYFAINIVAVVLAVLPLDWRREAIPARGGADAHADILVSVVPVEPAEVLSVQADPPRPVPAAGG